MNEFLRTILQLIIKNLKENLQVWFINIGKQIENISMDNELVTSRKIAQIIKALDEVQGITLVFLLVVNTISIIYLLFINIYIHYY